MYDRLGKLSGGQFDDQFVKAMVADHKKDIAKYDKEAESKGPLADFAKETLQPSSITGKQRKHWKSKNKFAALPIQRTGGTGAPVREQQRR